MDKEKIRNIDVYRIIKNDRSLTKDEYDKTYRMALAEEQTNLIKLAVGILCLIAGFKVAGLVMIALFSLNAILEWGSHIIMFAVAWHRIKKALRLMKKPVTIKVDSNLMN